ncbi:pectin lyase fold/virulence factor [Mycena rebaudengoi]|nr:pectin lyase fold/virulence factor [Mycena rebaudengoi]
MLFSTTQARLLALVGFLCAITANASNSKDGHDHDHSNGHGHDPHPPPPPPKKNCVVEHNRNGADDSPHILKAFSDCATNSVITFQAANYSAYTPVSLVGLDNVVIHLNGNLLLPNDMSRVQHEINITTNQRSTYATPWFYIHGSNVQLIASTDPKWGKFHGFGQHWWDLGNRTLRPQLATFNVTNGLMRNVKVIKPIAWGWNLPGKNIRVENHFVDAQPNNGTRTNTVSFPFNTDGINVSGENIVIDGYFGHNGDDCVSVINGARNVYALNGFCGFSSHGLSIGSLGKNGSVQTVKDVVFKNWTMDGAVYGARFKSWKGGAGFADNVTWEDITLVNVSTAIFITQNYFDQDLGPPPTAPGSSSTLVSNFKYKNFKGSLNVNWTDGTCITNPCWNFIQGGDATQSIIFDLYPGTATNISVGKVDVHPFRKSAKDTTVICDPATLAAGEQATLGFNCTRGLYVRTPIRN